MNDKELVFRACGFAISKLKCSGCGNTFYTCECEIDYESIEKEWKAVDRAKAKPGH